MDYQPQADWSGLWPPVAENPTVVMQEAGFRALGLNWRYLTMEVIRRIWRRPFRGFAP